MVGNMLQNILGAAAAAAFFLWTEVTHKHVRQERREKTKRADKPGPY